MEGCNAGNKTRDNGREGVGREELDTQIEVRTVDSVIQAAVLIVPALRPDTTPPSLESDLGVLV